MTQLPELRRFRGLSGMSARFQMTVVVMGSGLRPAACPGMTGWWFRASEKRAKRRA
jgi:hypothetical protein